MDPEKEAAAKLVPDVSLPSLTARGHRPEVKHIKIPRGRRLTEIG